MLVNIDTLTKLTGSTRRTILNKCHDLTRVQGKGREHLFESKDALPLVLGLHKRGETNKTLETERTRLATAQAEKVEIEVEVLKRNLIHSDQVETVVNTMLIAFKSKLTGLPSKAAHSVVQLTDHAEAENVLREYVNEALQELSEYESEKYCTLDDKSVSEATRTPTHTNDKPVGGCKTTTKS